MRKSDIVRKGFVSPLVKGSIAAQAVQPQQEPKEEINRYFNVFWNKASTKKHKATDDGYLVGESSGTCRLLDSDRKEISKARLDRSLIAGLSQGKSGNIGIYEFEIASELPAQSWNALAGNSKPGISESKPQLMKSIVKSSIKTPSAAPVTSSQPSPAPGQPSVPIEGSRAYSVFWCKSSTKVHKTYDDGFLCIAADGTWTLSDSTGTLISKLRKPGGVSSELEAGSKHRLATFEIEIQNTVPLGAVPVIDSRSSPNCDAKKRKHEDENSAPVSKPKPSIVATPFKSVTATQPPRIAPKLAPPATVHADAFALYTAPPGSNESIVAVEPLLSRHLRPHQREGVKFLYDCVMGIRNNEFTGCILADEMGLGKTLQSIALLWTLLKQGPKGTRVVQKCIVVCPAGLVSNWVKEVRKWLTDTRLKPLYMTTTTNKKKKEVEKGSMQDILTTFSVSAIYPLLIVSYEQVRSFHAQLRDMHCDLIICDEGHRIKNAASQVGAALNSLKAPRRIILSGTPIQNDLEEFFCMMNFVCPGLLGEQSQFKRKFATPIQAAREPSATPAVKGRGQQLTEELTSLTGQFILRRTAAILQGFLPPKTEQVIVCRMTELQQRLYKGVLESKVVQQLLIGAAGDSLFYINVLRKICTHPQMVRELSKQGQLFEGSEEVLPEDLENPAYSGKAQVLQALLKAIHETTNDKVLLVSNYTQTLDMLEKICAEHKYPCLRIDGSTDARNRTAIVDRFNSTPAAESFILLLSAKAGGIGFNVTGSNRLIMFDPDWNPAVDRQVIGRVYREGQKKPVFVYRLLSTGTIEEKVFQRQSHKQGLSNALVDEGSLDVGKGIALELLRDLFTFSPHTLSDTHDQLKCNCLIAEGEQMQIDSRSKSSLGMHELRSWDHLAQLESAADPMLVQLAENDPDTAERVSFVFVTSNGVRSADEIEDNAVDKAEAVDQKEHEPFASPPKKLVSKAASLDDDDEFLQLED